jgi:hypothetical protein
LHGADIRELAQYRPGDGAKAAYAAAAQWSYFTTIVEEDASGPIVIPWSLFVLADRVHLVDLPLEGGLVEVFNVSGQRVLSRQFTAWTMLLKLPARQLFFIRIGKRTEKAFCYY